MDPIEKLKIAAADADRACKQAPIMVRPFLAPLGAFIAATLDAVLHMEKQNAGMAIRENHRP